MTMSLIELEAVLKNRVSGSDL